MRTAWVAVLVILLAGCLGTSQAPDGPGDGLPEDGPEDRAEAAPNLTGVPAPRLEVGTSFTFRTDGVYDGEQSVTVVVARADDEGYLLAGVSPEDLPSAIAWHRHWVGPLDPELNKLDLEEGSSADVLDFPLHDGKQWDWAERRMTARATQVDTPHGPRDGFQVTDDAEGWSYRYTYAPELGFFTSFTTRSGEVVYEHAVLEAVGTSKAWTWYEELERHNSGNSPADAPANAATFELEEATEALVVSAGGTPGSRLVLTPPAGSGQQPWTFESLEGQSWETAIFPAATGPWSVATSWTEEGYVWGEMVGVRWIGPG